MRFLKYRRRRSYLLLELMISFMIVSLVALPLLRNPLHALKMQLFSLERMEIERLADLSFANMQAEIACQEVPWKAFSQEQKGECYSIDTIPLLLPGIAERKYERKTFFWTLAQKEGENNQEHRLVRIQFVFSAKEMGKREKPLYFNYNVFLSGEKKLPSS